MHTKTKAEPASKWKIAAIPPSRPSDGAKMQKIEETIRQLRSNGKRILGLHEGDVVVFGHINSHLSELLSQASKEGWDMYPTSTNWVAQLKEEIVEFETEYRNSPCTVADIIIAPGIAACYQLLHNALLDPGDEIVAISPSHYLWGPTSYMQYLQAKIIECESTENEGWQPSVDSLRNVVTDKTKMIVINYPNNPTGAIPHDDVCKEIFSVAAENDLLILSDEIYSTVAFDGKYVGSLSRYAKEVPVISLYSMSKSFMKPGWRVGYMVFHDPDGRIRELENVVGHLARLYGHGTSAIPTPILVAATRAFRERNEGLLPHYQDVSANMMEHAHGQTEMVRNLQSNRDFTHKRLNEIPHMNCFKPESTLYAFPRVDLIGEVWRDDEEFILDLLKTEGILFTPGNVFGRMGAKHFRTILTPRVEILEEAYGRLDEFIRKRSTKRLGGR